MTSEISDDVLLIFLSTKMNEGNGLGEQCKLFMQAQEQGRKQVDCEGSAKSVTVVKMQTTNPSSMQSVCYWTTAHTESRSLSMLTIILHQLK